MNILIADDDYVTRQLLSEVLEATGFKVFSASSAEEALAVYKQNPFPIVLTDIRMKEKSGLDLLREIKALGRKSIVILMTGFGSMSDALEAIKLGAFDYLSKPFKIEDMRELVQRAAKDWETSTTLDPARDEKQLRDWKIPALVGKESNIVQVYKKIAKASLSSSNVLILGKPGTGKAVVARMIHDQGGGQASGFLRIYSPKNLRNIEPFLGVISGEKRDFVEANRTVEYTVFIEEVDAYSETELTELFSLLESQNFPNRDYRLRWIASSLVGKQEISSRILHHFDVIRVDVPSLRDRAADFEEIIHAYLFKLSTKIGRPQILISDECIQWLKERPWEGNLKELEYVLERAVLGSQSNVLRAEDFAFVHESKTTLFQSPPVFEISRNTAQTIDETEKALILSILEQCGYNKTKASEKLGIDRATLYRKLKSYGYPN